MSHASHDSDLATSLQAHLRGLCSISEVFAYLATSLNEDHEDIWEELVTDGGLDNASGDSLPCFYVDWPDEGIMEQSTRMVSITTRCILHLEWCVCGCSQNGCTRRISLLRVSQNDLTLQRGLGV